MHRFVLIGSLVFGLAAVAAADTHVVKPDGTGDFPTIQAAISAAANGDIIQLTDGIFTGDGNRDIDFQGKAITVRSQSGDPANCTIDCEGSVSDPHIAFYFRSGEGNSSLLEGITIINGMWEYLGPLAIHILHADPIIVGNVFVGSGIWFSSGNNSGQVVGNMFREFSGYDATGIELSGTVTIRDNTFASFTSYGSVGVNVSGTSSAVNTAVVEENTFRDFTNEALCIGVGGTGDAIITGDIQRNTFEDIEGSAIRLSGTGDAFLYGYIYDNILTRCGGPPYLSQAAIVVGGTGTVTVHAWVEGNTITDGGGDGIAIGGISGSMLYGQIASNTIVGNPVGISRGGNIQGLEIRNTILWDNGDDLSGGVLGETYCCDISDGDFCGQNGNICENPLFCGDFNPLRPYLLDGDSPCAAENNPGCGLIGAWPVGCNAPQGLEDRAGSSEAPAGFFLAGGRPNPFTHQVGISYGVPATLAATAVSLTVFNTAGRLVRTLVDAPQPNGTYTVTWDGSDRAGALVPGGVYFYQLSVGERQLAGRLLFTR